LFIHHARVNKESGRDGALCDNTLVRERIERHQFVRQPKKAAEKLLFDPRGTKLSQFHAESADFAQLAAHGVALIAQLAATVLDLVVRHTET
jgi:hypothetical protein